MFRPALLLLLLALLVTACVPHSVEVEATAAEATLPFSTLESVTSTPTRLAARTEPVPLRVGVKLGESETVMDYSRDSCPGARGLDLPDIQARAFRSPLDESVILVSGNAPINYWMNGPDFNNLSRNCEPVLISGDNPNAFSFDNQEWITSVYRVGDIIHALVHNEFHDPLAPNCLPGVSDTSNLCWYNAITYAVSTDGGRTFTQVNAPSHVVAAPHISWNPGEARRGRPGPHGYFSPSNIVHAKDGFYYSMFFAILDPQDQSVRGTCLMRTDRLSEPSSWRAWDGRDFSIEMSSPYDQKGNPLTQENQTCVFVSPETIQDLHGSLTYNTYLERYILVGSGVFYPQGKEVCGTFFSLSADLIHWSPMQTILPHKLPYPPCTESGPDGSYIYPSLIDHNDSSPNFEFSGQNAYLYFVVWNHDLDRDLIRIPIEFEILP